MNNFKDSILEKALTQTPVSNHAFVEKWLRNHPETDVVEVSRKLWKIAYENFHWQKSEPSPLIVCPEKMNFWEFISGMYEILDQKYKQNIPEDHPIFLLLSEIKKLIISASFIGKKLDYNRSFCVFSTQYFSHKVQRVLEIEKPSREIIQQSYEMYNKSELQWSLIDHWFDTFSDKLNQTLQNYFLNHFLYDLEVAESITEDKIMYFTQEFLKEENYYLATKILQKWLEYFKWSTLLLTKMGDIYLDTQEFNAASDYYCQVLQKDPNNKHVLLQVSEVFRILISISSWQKKDSYINLLWKFAGKWRLVDKDEKAFYKYLGYYYSQMQKYKLANENFEIFYEKNAVRDEEILKELAKNSFYMEDYEKCLDCCIDFLKYEIFDSDVWGLLWDLAKKIGVPIESKLNIIIETLIDMEPFEFDSTPIWDIWISERKKILFADDDEFRTIVDTMEITKLVDIISSIFWEYMKPNTQRIPFLPTK